jgi:hypothetical protein
VNGLKSEGLTFKAQQFSNVLANLLVLDLSKKLNLRNNEGGDQGRRCFKCYSDNQATTNC